MYSDGVRKYYIRYVSNPLSWRQTYSLFYFFWNSKTKAFVTTIMFGRSFGFKFPKIFINHPKLFIYLLRFQKHVKIHWWIFVLHMYSYSYCSPFIDWICLANALEFTTICNWRYPADSVSLLYYSTIVTLIQRLVSRYCAHASLASFQYLYKRFCNQRLQFEKGNETTISKNCSRE